MRCARLVVLLAAATALSGCATTDAIRERISPEQPSGPPTVTIGVLAPLSGGSTRDGRSVVDAVEQAVADSGGVPGWQVKVAAYDLAPASLEQSLAELKTDDSTVAVVAGFTADDIRTVVPELDESGLTVISPADSDPRHTRGADPAAPLRPWSGYVTVAVEPSPEPTALADHLARVVGTTRVVVVGDGTSSSTQRARDVADALAERGVLDTTVVPWRGAKQNRALERAVGALQPGDTLVVDGDADLVSRVAAQRPDGVVLALTSPLADLSRRQAIALSGATAPLPGLDPRRGAAELSRIFDQAGTSATEGLYGPAAYDGAALLVDTLTRCLPDPSRSTSPSRSACRAEVAGTSWDGLTGAIQFDEFGARLGLLPTVVILRKGSWQTPGG